MAVQLPGDASDSAVELRDALAPLLDASEPLILDAGRVHRISTASLQILLAALRAAQERAIPVRWESVSPALHEAATCLGLATALQLPSSGGTEEGLGHGKDTGG
jgi:anti-anti-sigma regulatory factor